jgi:hypothetical protein
MQATENPHAPDCEVCAEYGEKARAHEVRALRMTQGPEEFKCCERHVQAHDRLEGWLRLEDRNWLTSARTH